VFEMTLICRHFDACLPRLLCTHKYYEVKPTPQSLPAPLENKGIPYPLAAFENKRSFLSIENLCFVISELLGRNDIPSGVYNVADDESLSTNELVQEMAFSLGLKPRLWALPAAWIQSAAKLGDRWSLPLNTERLNKLTESYVVSNAKIKNALV
jgi:nucleoside-diphosphate-sugar epimerase